MKRTRNLLAFAALTALSLGAIALPASPAAAIPVFDASNYAENVLQAARALEQINNQIKSLQNEAAMLKDMERHLQTVDFSELSRVTSALQQIDQVMGKARGIEFKIDQLDEQFRTLFPDAGSALRTDQRLAGAKAQLETAMGSFRHSMAVQSQIVANVRDDAELLRELANRSQSAVGSLQAQQATNQLLALSTKQQFQLQELMAAEFRSQAVERARRDQAEAEARAATRRFLGTGKAYSQPH
jgi:P-type conjugative transfer protein TrbJ